MLVNNGAPVFDRTVPRQRQEVIRYKDNEGMEYGNLPADALMRKFEETNTGPDEDLYDNYARIELSNWGPDRTQFAYEESRGAVNRPKGILEHHYYGQRGSAEVERPEIFLGFAGPENHDPRGVVTDPDMKKMARQADARNRFVRFSADDSAFITGGGRSQGKLQEDQQSLFRWARERLKVFDRQLDGRREGLRRVTPLNESGVKKQIYTQSYGDYIADYAMNPQRRANLICKQAIRDSTAWREGTADQDFQIAKYSQLCRTAKRKDSYVRVLGAKNNDDTVWTDADSTVPYKTMGMLMASIINARKQVASNMVDSDRDYGVSVATESARKSAPFKRDLELVMYATVQTSDMGQSDETVTGRTPTPQQREHSARLLVYNHLVPAHHYLNAEVVYKTLRQGNDLSKIKHKVVADASAPQIRDMATAAAAKSASMKQTSGAKLATAEDTHRADAGMTTFSYKNAAKRAEVSRLLSADGEDVGATGDTSQTRRPNHTSNRGATKDDFEVQIDFNDNTSKERLRAPMGGKYMARHIMRDSAAALSDLS